eukprot:3394424-Alexandrium_andersonii.AAC.1
MPTAVPCCRIVVACGRGLGLAWSWCRTGPHCRTSVLGPLAPAGWRVACDAPHSRALCFTGLGLA